MTAHLVVLSGPSGVGKSSVIAQALSMTTNVWLSVSATTRSPRPGEVDGVNYFYISREDFQQRVDAGDFLEWAEFAGNLYGTLREPVLERLASNIPVLLEIEVQGATQVREAMPEAVLVFLEPPSWEELESRLIGRGTESDEQVLARLRMAHKEIEAARDFDHIIVNHDVIASAEELVSYLS